MIVVDASVAVKWLLPESDQLEADIFLRDSSILIAPTQLRLEVAGAITRRCRNGELVPERALERYRTWLEMLADGAVRLLPDEELLDEAVALSLQLKHSLQDCIYLAAAKQHDVPLITADRAFQKRAVAVYPDARLLPGCQR